MTAFLALLGMTLVITATSEPEDSAIAAGLRYVSDIMPGIRRKRSGRGFSGGATGSWNGICVIGMRWVRL